MIDHLVAIVLSLAPHMMPVEYRSNYDGDTISFESVFDGWGIPLTVRVQNIDTPEIRGSCDAEKALARRARDEAAALLRSAGEVRLGAVQPRLDVYGRILANVAADGVDLGGRLVELGLARPWDGARRPWC